MALGIIAYDALHVGTRMDFDLWWTHTNFKKMFAIDFWRCPTHLFN
jgi:hypothetical protein